jgi:cytochrome bd-type quinol oxidase subunit 2
MKRFIAPFFGILFAFGLASGLMVEVGSAQMISEGDMPANLIEATGNYKGSFRTALTTIVNYFLFLLGLIAVIMVIYGGLLYITSGGDDAGAEKGKKILMYAAIGIIVILISYALVNTLLEAGSIEAPQTFEAGGGGGGGTPPPTP